MTEIKRILIGLTLVCVIVTSCNDKIKVRYHDCSISIIGSKNTKIEMVEISSSSGLWWSYTSKNESIAKSEINICSVDSTTYVINKKEGAITENTRYIHFSIYTIDSGSSNRGIYRAEFPLNKDTVIEIPLTKM